MREDDRGVCLHPTPHIRAIRRRIALHVRKQANTARLGIANKRLKAAWDLDYRRKLLALMLQAN